MTLTNSTNNTISNNNVSNSGWYGIRLEESENNRIDQNTICSNYIYDFFNADSAGNSGNGNTCQEPGGWNDSGTYGCTYLCYATTSSTTTSTTTTTTLAACTWSAGRNLSAGNTSIDFQTAHNYTNNMSCWSDSYSCPAGYYAKVYVKYETEEEADNLWILDPNTGIFNEYSGNSGGFIWLTPNNASSNIRFRFSSDYATTAWGVDVDAVNCYNASTITTSSTTTTSTTQVQCTLPGDYPPCGEISIQEIIDMINKWMAGTATLGEVIDLINAWASG